MMAKNLQKSVALVCKRTIPKERQPLVGEVSANFYGKKVSRGECDGPIVRNLGFLGREIEGRGYILF
jgi:hypothetical protein